MARAIVRRKRPAGSSRLPRGPLLNLALLALVLGAERVGERHPLTTMPTYAPQFLFALPTVVLLVAGIVRRDHAASLVNVLSLAFCLFALLGLRVGPLAPPAAEGQPLRMMTFNVEKWSHGTNAVAETIRGQHPDVVCLQEAGKYFWLKRPDQTPAALVKALPEYRFVAAGEIMVGSRLPVTAWQKVPLPPGPESRPAVIATVDLHGRAEHVVSVHLMPSGFDQILREPGTRGLRFVREENAARMAQATVLRTALQSVPPPFVAGGDFNAQPQTRVCRLLTDRFRDAFDEAGRGFGYTLTATFPASRIDHLLLGGVHARRAFVPNVLASDHRPLVADLTVP